MLQASFKITNACWSLGRPLSESRMHWGLNIARNENIKRIRIYDSTPTPSNLLAAAKKYGINVVMGAWLEKEDAGDREQLHMLYKAIESSAVEPVALLGNEVLMNDYFGSQQLISYMDDAKSRLAHQVPVTTCEDAKTLLNHHEIIDASRHIVGMHHYPYTDGVHIDNALDDLVEKYELIRALSGGKRVVIYETGWPSAGGRRGQALASLANARRYHREVASWAAQHGIEVFIFEIFDEDWKVAIEGPHGGSWGIRRIDGSQKYPR